MTLTFLLSPMDALYSAFLPLCADSEQLSHQKVLVFINITESAHHVLGSDADLSHSLMLLDSLVGHSDS